jgi:hypothetical protein
VRGARAGVGAVSIELVVEEDIFFAGHKLEIPAKYFKGLAWV